MITRGSTAKVHRILNHRRVENMKYAYKNAGKLTPETRALIKEMVENCTICSQAGRSRSKPAIRRVSDINALVTLDLKEFEKVYVLWIVCALSS